MSNVSNSGGKTMSLENKSAKSDFGKRGWGLIVFCGFMLFFSTGTSVDGLNVTVAGLAALHNWDTATLLGFSTISGLISIIGMFIFGLICDRVGPRKLAMFSLLAGGLSYIWYGHVQSMFQYAVALILVSLWANVFAWIAGGAYLSTWFPKRKGLALGWATIGNNMASAFIVIVLTTFSTMFGGIQWGITAVGVLVALLAIWAYFTPDTPQEAGQNPDNAPGNKEDIFERAQKQREKSKWTFGMLLKTKEFWFISASLGIFMLVTVGVMSQLVPRMMSLGFSMEKAIATMTVCALIGCVGSYLWGVVDQKLSTKVATALYGVWYAIAIIFNVIPNVTCLYISIVMIGFAIGGNANWPASLTTSVYGHKNFAKVYSLINPAISVVRMMAFTVLAISLKSTGSYTAAYVLFIILAFVAAGLVMLINDKKYSQDEDSQEVKNEIEG